MRATRILFFLLTVALALNVAATEPDPAGTPTERISGKWILNEKHSESFDKLARRGRPSGVRGGGPGGGLKGGRGGGMGGGPGGGNGGAPGGDEDRNTTQNRKMDPRTHMKKKFERLEIYINGLELNVTDGLDITHLLYTDARQVTIWTERGEAKAQALWSGDELEVRWQASNGDTARIRYYIPSEDGQTLTVVDRLRQPDSEEFVSLQMVYDRTK